MRKGRVNPKTEELDEAIEESKALPKLKENPNDLQAYNTKQSVLDTSRTPLKQDLAPVKEGKPNLKPSKTPPSRNQGKAKKLSDDRGILDYTLEGVEVNYLHEFKKINKCYEAIEMENGQSKLKPLKYRFSLPNDTESKNKKGGMLNRTQTLMYIMQKRAEEIFKKHKESQLQQNALSKSIKKVQEVNSHYEMFKQSRLIGNSQIEVQGLYQNLEFSRFSSSVNSLAAKVYADKVLAEQYRRTKVLMFRETDEWRGYWDYFVLAWAVFNAMFIPVVIAFNPMWSYQILYSTVDNISNIIFFLDMLVIFNTAIRDKDTEEIVDRRVIAKEYFKDLFIVDFVSWMPWDLFMRSFVEIKVLNMVKMVRLGRVHKIISKMKESEESKASIQILRLVFMMLFYLHLFACIWFMVASQSSVFVNTPDFYWVTTTRMKRQWDQHEYGLFDQYMQAFFQIVCALGGNEVGPRGVWETFVIWFILVFLVIYLAIVFGEMMVLVGECMHKSIEFQERIDVANTAMGNLELDPHQRSHIRHDIVKMQVSALETEQLKQFLNTLSPSLNQKVQFDIFKRSLLRNLRTKHFLENVVEAKRRAQEMIDFTDGVNRDLQFYSFLIVSKMKTEIFEPDQHIIRNLDSGNKLYLIAKGEVKAIVQDQQNIDNEEDEEKWESTDHDDQKTAGSAKCWEVKHPQVHENVNLLRPGSYFGEISVVFDCERSADVVTAKYCTLASLDKTAYKEVLLQMPEFRDMLIDQIYLYNDSQLQFITNRIQSVPFFANLEQDCLYNVMFSLTTKAYLQNTIFQKPGDAANVLYLLQKGCIEVFTYSEGQEFVIERLFRGSVLNYHTFFQEEYAGELYLRFARNSILKQLELSRMLELCEQFPKLKKNFDNFKLQTYKADLKLPLDYILALPLSVMQALYNQTTQMMMTEKQDQIKKFIQDEELKHGHMDENKRVRFVLDNIVTRQERVQKLRQQILLTNIFKNLAMKRLCKIQQTKEDLTIGEVVQLALKKQQEEEQKKRRKIKKKIERSLKITANTFNQNPKEKGDMCFNRVLFDFKRILKILMMQTAAIDNLERSLEIYSQQNSPELGVSKHHNSTDLMLATALVDDQHSNSLNIFSHEYDDVSKLLEQEGLIEREMDAIGNAKQYNLVFLNEYKAGADQVAELNIESAHDSFMNISSEETSEKDQDEQNS